MIGVDAGDLARGPQLFHGGDAYRASVRARPGRSRSTSRRRSWAATRSACTSSTACITARSDALAGHRRADAAACRYARRARGRSAGAGCGEAARTGRGAGGAAAPRAGGADDRHCERTDDATGARSRDGGLRRPHSSSSIRMPPTRHRRQEPRGLRPNVRGIPRCPPCRGHGRGFVPSRAAPERDLPLRRYRCAGAGDAGVLLYLHGGGFILGGLDSHDDVCAELCRAPRSRWCRSTTAWRRSTPTRPRWTTPRPSIAACSPPTGGSWWAATAPGAISRRRCACACAGSACRSPPRSC